MESWTCKHCSSVPALTNVTFIDNSKTHIVGFVGYQKSTRTIIYAFRCTVDYRNYFEDFSFLLVPYTRCKECQVHIGFYEAFKSIESKVIATATKLLAMDPEAQILSIGHSLGGAMATLTALELQHRFIKVKELHTFGAPRIGNSQLAAFMKEKLPNTYRVIHYRDLAPHLPFEANGYRHHPFEVLFDEQMKEYTVCNDSGEDLHCSNKYFPEYEGKYHMTYFVTFDC